MDTVFQLEVAPGEAKLLRAIVKSVLAQARKDDLEVSGQLIAARLIKNFESGEREYSRLRALVLGPEAAPVRHAN